MLVKIITTLAHVRKHKNLNRYHNHFMKLKKWVKKCVFHTVVLIIWFAKNHKKETIYYNTVYV
jgi:hypothetical protein